jgi:LuxR family maltose regulon positive regulatory protein
MTRLPTVRDDTLLTEPPLRVGMGEWYRWLETARSFAWRGAGGRFTARREERSGSHFWYAYRRQNGALRKTYLGRSSELTAERLAEAARTLADMAQIAQEEAGEGENERGAAQSAEKMDGWLSPLIATKIAAPQSPPSLVARPAALAHCRESVEHPCAIVAAPAGFGKTTLLTMVAEAMRGDGWQVAWVTLEESEQDPIRFWQYALAALDHVQPGLGATARHMLEVPRPVPIERILTVLINELAAVRTPILLVLDDYHRAATPVIDRALIFLIEHAPAPLHLLVAARATPAFPLARLRAQGRIAELDASALRFSMDEARRFMRETMRLTLPPAQLAQIEERTEGWVAGLQLAALSLRGQTDAPALLDETAATPRYIAEYLIDEVLERQPDDVQAFLLQTAPLERLSGPLCDAVTGRSDSAALLDRLMRAQLFVTPLDSAQTWYRYHHLFAEVLRERLARRMPELVVQCHQRAADWLWRHDMADDAIRHLLAAELYAEAADRIERQSDRLVLHGEVAGLANWVRALPHEAVLAHPHLCLLVSVALLLQGEEPAAVAWLEELERRYTETNPLPDEMRGELDAVRAFLQLWSGDIAGGAARAQQALRRLPPDERLLRMLTIWMSQVIGVFGEGNLAEAERSVSVVAEDSRRSGNMLVAFIALVTKASAQIYRCRLLGAAETCEEALRMLPEHGKVEVPMAAMAYCLLGEIRREWNDLDAAETLLRRALAISENLGSPEYINDGLIYLGQVLLARGQYDEALATFERIRTMVRARQLAPWDLTQMEIVRARALIARGDLEDASRWAEARLRMRQSGDVGPTPPLAFMNDLEDLSIARIFLARGDTAASIAILEPVRARSEETEQWRNLMEARMLLALAYAQNGKTDAALCELDAALAIAAPEGFVRIFLDEGAAMADLLERYLACQPSPASTDAWLMSPTREHARRLLAAFGRAVEPAPGALAEALSAREVDVLRLLAQGLSNEAIASDLVLALSTVKWHVAHIYRKLGVRGRVRAVARARELRLIA